MKSNLRLQSVVQSDLKHRLGAAGKLLLKCTIQWSLIIFTEFCSYHHNIISVIFITFALFWGQRIHPPRRFPAQFTGSVCTAASGMDQTLRELKLPSLVSTNKDIGHIWGCRGTKGDQNPNSPYGRRGQQTHTVEAPGSVDHGITRSWFPCLWKRGNFITGLNGVTHVWHLLCYLAHQKTFFFFFKFESSERNPICWLTAQMPRAVTGQAKAKKVQDSTWTSHRTGRE